MSRVTSGDGQGRHLAGGVVCLGFLAALLAAAPATADDEVASGGAVTILDGSGFWRALHSWAAPWVTVDKELKEHKPDGRRVCKCTGSGFRYMTRYPAREWTQVEFDDSTWPRRHFFAKYVNGESDQRAGGGSGSSKLRQLSLRGKFTVTDPAKVTGLSLTMAYRGGVVAYLNGRELTRAHLPEGELAAGAPAEMYPAAAYLKENGKVWNWWGDRNTIGKGAYPLRIRRLTEVPVPAGTLRKGTNVLGVEIHAASYPEVFAKWRSVPDWATAGLIELRLQADEAEGIVPNVVRPAELQVWNTSVAEQVFDASWGDPHEPLKPIALAGARSGCCSGRVIVSSGQPMRNLRAKVGEFVGPGGRKLPPSAVAVRYGKFDQPRGSRWGGSDDGRAIQWHQLPLLRDDTLVEDPPQEVPVTAKAMPRGVAEARRADGLPPKLVDGAIQPVWVVAEIPPDASPGSYRGKLTITVDGHKPIEAPVELDVIDYLVPDPADYTYFMGMIQSPEGVALRYDVPLWSDRHCRLVSQSLKCVGKLGPKVLYIPLGAESQYGNEQSMVLWVKDPAGGYTHDFIRVEKYLDLALKHMGKPTFAVVGVWDSCMHVSVPKALRRSFPRVSVREPGTGRIANIDGPPNGTPESLAFWKPVLVKMRQVLAARGLGQAMLLGYCADRQPDKATVGVFHEILPDVGWQGTRHPPIRHDTLAYEGGAVPIRYQANVWGGWDNHDPDCRRVYGWKYPDKPGLRTWLDRGLFDASPICQFRTACEQSLLADRRGLGQIGADFWPVKNADGKRTHTMVGRFPATSEGNLGIYSGQLLYPGPRGPVPTVRYQMMRENIQACEARIFLERLLLEEPCRLDGRLAAKCRDLLDERTRWHRMQGVAPAAYLSWPYSGWEARLAKLYHAAAEAAHALAKK